MSANPVVEAKPRESTGSSAAKKLRSEGMVPAILYGSDVDPLMLQVGVKSIRDIIHSAASDNFMVDLKVEAGGSVKKAVNQLALLQEAQMDPVSRELLHVDFRGVSAKDKLTAEVALELVGTPAGAQEGGVTDQILFSLPVECLPKDLPNIIQVNIEHMVIGDTIHVGEVELPKGVVATGDPENPVVAVTEPKMVEEPEPETVATEPEVIGESGEEEEAAEEGGDEKSSE